MRQKTRWGLALGALVVTAGFMTGVQSQDAASVAESLTAEEGASHNHVHSERDIGGNRTPIERMADSLWVQADRAYHDGNYEKSIEAYKALVVIEPDNAEAYGTAAWLLWSLGRGDEAAELVLTGARKNPHDWDVNYNTAEHFQLAEPYSERAHRFFEKALALNPPPRFRQLILHRLAFAAEKSKDNAQALKLWQQSVSEFPNDFVANRQLSRLQAGVTGPQ